MIGAQVFGAFHSISFGSASSADGIAWMAHLGGFIAGGLYGWRLAPWVKKGQFA